MANIPAEEQTKKSDSLSPIRTFERDVAELVERENVSLTNIALAEQKRKIITGEMGGGSVIATISARNKVFIIIGSLLLAAGLGVIGYLAFFKKTPEPPQVRQPEKQVISAEFTKEINISGLNQKQLFAAILNERKNNTISPTSILRLRLTFGNEGLKRDTTVEELLRALKTANPSYLTRALKPEFTLGLQSLTSTEPFIIFKVADYENAFSGMLAWEKTVAADLGPIFIPETGSAKSELNRLEETPFQDRIILNKDARVLPRENQTPALLYSFPDKDTLVVTTNENTFKEVLERLRTAKFIR